MATLRFQPTRREAWLIDLDDTSARTEGDLCARHASGLVLPRGWRLHDERTVVEAAPVVEPPPRRPARTASIARARRRRSVRSDPPLPDLAPVPVVEHEPEPVVVVDVVEVIEVVDVIEVVEPEPAASTGAATGPSTEPLLPMTEPAREELEDTLDAQTPLLKRAFQNVWPLDD